MFKVFELHNHFHDAWNKWRDKMPTSEFDPWNEYHFNKMPDRYYLVESMQTANSDYDNKTFLPRVKVRYLLRSAEANAYGRGHQAFHQRYLSTIPFTYDDLGDLQKAKDYLVAELTKPRN